MGRDEGIGRRGKRKKVAKLCRWAEQLVKNGEPPPLKPLMSGDEIRLYESRGVALLDDEYEIELSRAFLRSIVSAEAGMELNFRVIELWCEREELDTLEVYDILRAMLNSANKERSRQWSKKSYR